MDNKTGSNHWSQCSEEMQKNTGNIGKLSNRGLRFGHDMAIHGPQSGPKSTLFPNALFFTLSLGFVDDFKRRSYPKRPNMRSWPEVLFQGSQSCVEKGPNQRNTLYSMYIQTLRKISDAETAPSPISGAGAPPSLTSLFPSHFSLSFFFSFFSFFSISSLFSLFSLYILFKRKHFWEPSGGTPL